MNWIKKRYDQFGLLIAVIALIAGATLLTLRSQSFAENFEGSRATVVPSEKIPELDLTTVKAAESLADQPVKWQLAKDANPFVFASPRIVISKESGQPVPPGGFSLYADSLTGKPIPNNFFLDSNLPLFDPTVPKQDPDKDGFTNEDEWRGIRDYTDATKWHDGTDPNDPNSHPTNLTKLVLKKWIRVPFRLLFQAYDGDPKKPAEMQFQINAIDRGRKTEFLKLGDKVTNSNYRLEKFDFKEIVNPSTDARTDVSELTVLNIETNDTVVLVKEKVTDSPDSYALFDYQITGKDIQVKKLGKFVLLPDKDQFYKLVDIKEGEALIQLPDGTTNYVVTPDPRKK
jgi:hypothetical protein